MNDLARIEAMDIRGELGGDLEGARLVRVTGEIDLSNAREVMDAIAEAVPNDVSVVVVDLSETTYLDSSGIAMIFRLAERLGYSRQELRLVVPSDAPIRAVLELTNLPQVIPVLDAIGETTNPG